MNRPIRRSSPSRWPRLGEQLDADIIKVNAAVHARLHVRLGDDQRAWPAEERTNGRRHDHEVAPAPEHAHVGIAQEAEPRALHRIRGDIALGEAVFAHAEEGEIVGANPVEERDRFRDLCGRQRRWIDAIRLGRLEQARAHRHPVADGDANVVVDERQPFDQARARGGVIDAVDVDVQEAFAPRARGCDAGRLADEATQRAVGIAFDARGWDARRAAGSMSCATSSASVESSRNGMSSLTTSSTVNSRASAARRRSNGRSAGRRRAPPRVAPQDARIRARRQPARGRLIE